MPKRVFWPAVLVVMGLIYLASNMGYLPSEFWNLWPVMLIVVGLGGLLISDREEWHLPEKKVRKKSSSTKTSKKSSATKKKTSRTAKKSSRSKK